MRKKAFAKVTFYLHALESDDETLHFRNVLVPIDLFDMVYLDKHSETYIETNMNYLPNDRRNTVYKAIAIMRRRYHIKDHFKVRIVKNIPAQSGLGGGSADAAAVIRMIDEMYGLNLSREALIDVAKEIDEDTPFCLFNEPSLVEGYGEKLTPIPLNMDLYYVMVKPNFGVSTQSFLKHFKKFQVRTSGLELCIKGMREAMFELLSENIHNDFEATVTKRNRKLKKVRAHLENLGLKGVCMSGSGTSVYGLCLSREEAISIYEEIVFQYPFVKYGKIMK